MDVETALAFVREHHRAVLVTVRRDGGPQLSPVIVGVDDEGRLELSSTEDRAKVRNLRRNPRASACVFEDGFFGRWVQVDGFAVVVPLPEATAPLIAYYRRISGEHPDWDEYRRSMEAERRVLVRLVPERASGRA